MARAAKLTRARDDLATFAALAGRPLAKWQARALALDARVSYVLGPRQVGKSRSAALLACHRAFREPGHVVLIVSAGDLGAKRLLATVAEIVTSSPLLSASVVDEQSSLIRLTNGSTIRSVPASSKAIRGWAVDTLLLDEATELGDEIIDVAIPTTAARPDARIVMLSTGGAPLGRAYETYMAGLDPSSTLVRSFAWRLRDAKWVSKAAVEHARLTMPPWRFQAEYEGEWSGTVDALLAPDLLRRCTVDVELPDLASLRGPARLLGGVDWADSGPDQSALVAIARIPARGEAAGDVFVVWPAAVFAVGTEVTSAARRLAATSARWAVLSYEVNGLGAGASQVLRDEILALRDGERAIHRMGGGGAYVPPVGRHNPTTTTWERKADALGRLRSLAEGGCVLFAREEQFMRQLATVKVEHRAHSVGIEAPQGGHDDLIDAAYLATGAWSARGGQRRNVLAEAALRKRRVPAFPSGVATVETEGGIVIPRRPPLLSVLGEEVTAPLGAAAAHNPALVRARAQLAQAHEHKEVA